MAREVVEVAPSGRGKCGLCAKAIAQGTLRVGFKRDGSVAWFHVEPCAASEYPERLEYALARSSVKVPDLEALTAQIEAARPAARRARILPVDRAPSGRAACKHCKRFVAKGTLRANFDNYGESTGTSAIHVACIGAFVRGDAAVVRTVLRVADAREEAFLAALIAAIAVIERDAKAQELAREARKDAASLDVLADYLEVQGVVVAKDELAATVAIV